jgi:serine/threonine-protein kinase
MTPPPIAIGSLIDGKYRVESVLGAGGMGVVFLARHQQLRERVAIKVLKPERGDRPQMVERLFREARAAASLRSRHVVRVLDVGTLAEESQPFIVMEYLEGEDLATHLSSNGPMAPRDAVDAVVEACEAVAEAHVLGIVHRDLKPANLFLECRPSGAKSIKVLDFGVARFLRLGSDEARDDLRTSMHAFVGSPAYISPEQLTAPETVDTRADVWALGLILYESLSCQQPFRAPTLALTCTKILQDAVPPLARSDLPAPLLAALRRALKKNPEARFPSVMELARALAPFGSSRSQAALAEIEAIGLAPRAESAPPPARLSEGGAATLTGSVLHARRVVTTTRKLWAPALALIALTALLGWVAFSTLRPSASVLGPASAPASPSLPALAPSAPIDAAPPASASTEIVPTPELPPIRPHAAPSPVTTPRPSKPLSAVVSAPTVMATSPRPPATAAFTPLAPPAPPPPAVPAGDQSERLYEFRR